MYLCSIDASVCDKVLSFMWPSTPFGWLQPLDAAPFLTLRVVLQDAHVVLFKYGQDGEDE